MAGTFLIHRLNQMRMEGKLCDVHLVADDASTFPVHGLLLVAADEYFYRFLVNDNNGPIVIKADVSRLELESVVHFVYGVRNSGKQLEMGLRKMNMTRLLNQLANIIKENELVSTVVTGHGDSLAEMKPMIDINYNMGNIHFKSLNYSDPNTCARDLNLISPVKVKIEQKSDMEPTPLEMSVISFEHKQTVSLKQTLPENAKQRCLIEKHFNDMEFNSTFSDETPMPSLVKCETQRYTPSYNEEKTMPTLEKIECICARTPPGSLYPVIVKSEPISPPESPVPKVLSPRNSITNFENWRFACPESVHHMSQEVASNADYGVQHCPKERGQSQNEFSSYNRNLNTDDTILPVLTSSVPVIKTEKDCFEDMSDQCTLVENYMLILKDAQISSTSSPPERQIMQMNTSSIHSGKVARPKANKLADGNTVGTCTQFLDQSQNSVMGLPVIQRMSLYSPIGKSHSAEGIIIQNPTGTMVTLVPSAVSNLPMNYCASKTQQNIETCISSDKRQTPEAKFNGMKETTNSSPTKITNNSNIAKFVVYPGEVMYNMGSNRGRKKFSKIPMIMRRNSVSVRKRSYDGLKISDVDLHFSAQNTREVESKTNTSSGDLMPVGELTSSLNTTAVIDSQSFSITKNEHTSPCFIVVDRVKPKCSKQTKPKLFHGYSSSFIPIAPKFEN